MLKIIVDDKKFESYGKFDIEGEFSKAKFDINDYNIKACKFIDKAKLVSRTKFVDRFGATTDIKHLSTGCKAAILSNLGLAKPINLLECGWNARDFIICNAKSGEVILTNPGITFTKCSDSDHIDVECNGMHFRSIDELNDYMF